MLSSGQQTRSAATTSGAWASLLESEEAHVAAQGFGAGALAEVAILAVIDRHLGWTDRSELISVGRLGVVAVPIEGAETLVRRARELHHGLRAGGLAVDVAYALRRRTGGMASAAARADAALDNALARRTPARA